MGRSVLADATNETARLLGHMTYTQAQLVCEKTFLPISLHSSSDYNRVGHWCLPAYLGECQELSGEYSPDLASRIFISRIFLLR